MSGALIAEGLHTFYGKSHILHGVDLEVAEGKSPRFWAAMAPARRRHCAV